MRVLVHAALNKHLLELKKKKKKNVTANKHVMSQHAGMFKKCLCGPKLRRTVFHSYSKH